MIQQWTAVMMMMILWRAIVSKTHTNVIKLFVRTLGPNTNTVIAGTLYTRLT